jgi:hypothetical protein
MNHNKPTISMAVAIAVAVAISITVSRVTHDVGNRHVALEWAPVGYRQQ